MTRQLPEEWRDRAVPKMTCKNDGYITQVREYELITPLFGGGVTPAEADPVTIVRATEVRGHLRFWWRAMRGGQFGGLEEMKKAEDAIWGSAASFDTDGNLQGGPSAVQVVISKWTDGEPDVPFVVEGTQKKPQLIERPGTLVPAYAAFPLQPERVEQSPGMLIQSVLKDVRVTLLVSFPQLLHTDVAAALWAWETFGGIGARTRRGFGALRLVSIDGQAYADLPPADRQQFQQWLQGKLKQFVEREEWPENTPHLARKMRFALIKNGTALNVWKELIEKLQTFRQKRRDMNGRPNSHGHSDWSEPNAIRRLFGRVSRGPHAQRHIDKYPRAQFGLPIVFHMPHDTALDGTLEGADKEQSRFASPLILKPVACRDRKAIGLALILEGVPLPDHLAFKAKSGKSFFANATVTTSEARQIPPLNGQTDVLQAFLDTL